MKRILLCLLLTLLLVFPAAAQQEACEIDLTDFVVGLMQAQTAAASGDTESALAQIAQTRAALAGLIESCGAAGVEAGVLLENEFVAPNGSFVVNYPSNWVEGAFSPNPNGGGVFFGSSPTAATALNTTIPELQPGEQALAVAVGTPALLGDDSEAASLEDVLRAFTEGSLAQFEIISELEISSSDDRQIGRAQFRGESFEALLVGVQLPDSELIAVVVGVTAAGELDALRPIVEAVALSVR
jgi:hypothetical protein